AMLLVRERAAHRRRRAVADAAAARVPEPLVRLVEIPEPPRPAAEVARVVARDERPVFVLDLAPQLRGEPRGADGRGVPRVTRVDARGVGRAAARIGELARALLEDA